MFNLYNLLENPYSRFCVYMKALSLALNGKVTEHIIPSFKKMDSFLKEWNIGVQDQRELFISVSNVLKENKRYNGIPFLLVSMFGPLLFILFIDSCDIHVSSTNIWIPA